MRSFDVAVIGAGTAGLSAFHKARETTDSVVLIEKDTYGTTCARTGCMPSKLLIASADRAHSVRTAGDLGVHADNLRIDGEEVMHRLRALRDDFVEGVVEDVLEIPEELRLCAGARFVGPGRLMVGDEEIGAKAIVIATGSSPVVPDDIEEGTGGRYMTVEDLWELDDLPDDLLVFGAGVIGAETALALAHLGVRVRVLSKGGRVGFLSDPDVNAFAIETLRDEMPFAPDAEIKEMGWRGDRFHVRFLEEGRPCEDNFGAVLVATGRAPNLDGLDLGESGVTLDDEGVPRFDPQTRMCLGSGEHGVFIAGDADGEDMVLPEARQAGLTAGANAASWPKTNARDVAERLFIGFTEPGMALVGLSHDDLKHREDVAIGCARFEDQGRARCEARNRGIIKVYGEKGTGRFLGAEMMAPDAEHFAHLIAWGLQCRLGICEMADAPVYHPVTEEGLRSALRDCRSRL